MDWDKESLPHVGRDLDYEIIDESEDHNFITRLDLRWVLNAQNYAMARLPHRLKNAYRKMKNDLHSKDGRELIITFYLVPRGDSEFRWEIRMRRKPFPPPDIMPYSRAGTPIPPPPPRETP
jgi:hypothetical protein